MTYSFDYLFDASFPDVDIYRANVSIRDIEIAAQKEDRE